ncbi:MAG: hypothetical protein H0U71_05715 [Gammaproteobacteria bacterium]|nr:hypothetical protein [Gammaproteobacteria bacterium]
MSAFFQKPNDMGGSLSENHIRQRLSEILDGGKDLSMALEKAKKPLLPFLSTKDQASRDNFNLITHNISIFTKGLHELDNLLEHPEFSSEMHTP